MTTASTPAPHPAAMGFTADEFLKLSVEKRIEKCRGLAAEAMQLANKSTPEIRKSYLDIAADWHALAEELAKKY